LTQQTAHIGNYPTAKVYQQAFTVGFKIYQHFPDADAKINSLAFFTGINFYNIEISCPSNCFWISGKQCTAVCSSVKINDLE